MLRGFGTLFPYEFQVRSDARPFVSYRPQANSLSAGRFVFRHDRANS